MSEFRTTGIVLKRTNYAEADRILKVFTRDFGMVSAIAKGIKKTTSRQAGALELFVEADMHLHRRTGELFLVTRAHPAGHSQQPQLTDLASMKVAYLMAEWLVALVPAEQAIPQFYNMTIAVLHELSQTDRLPVLELAFQAKTLDMLGFLPSAFRDATTQKIIRFLTAHDLPSIMRLKIDIEIFKKVSGTLQEVYQYTTEREGRVRDATRDWL